MQLRKTIEWNMGHRIPGHDTDQHLHGHRFKLQVEIDGNIDDDSGLIIDLKTLKSILNKEVVEILDHSFMYSKKDEIMTAFFKKNEGLRSVAIDDPPTCENILLWILDRLKSRLDKLGLPVAKIILWESESSSVALDFRGDHNDQT